ncbi:putative apicomplexan-conserved protein [Carpediemonas membranifera]|uniref:Putative apicomplexan-conserved protein n=1 Tax=Carpediemonas membranifera TaxID=201153 RepID=A0A8J6AYY0_9EUKA|nr:putative apicomplexan-conserved protein [Carpediemonas membranifera]|eukprot:KAG9397453.1 putative apicomplexan-conserved protein [Carpediemonas membranifera]
MKRSDCSTLFLLDFDDTICPSSMLSTTSREQLQQSAVQRELKAIDKAAAAFIRNITTYPSTSVVIVSAGTSSWMTDALSLFPRLKRVLRNIRMVSARDDYEHMFPVHRHGPIDSPVLWKLASFQKIINGLAGAKFINVISIGDSAAERKAAKFLLRPDVLKLKGRRSSNKDKHAHAGLSVKSIQTAHNPTTTELIGQFSLLIGALGLLRFPVNIDGTVADVARFIEQDKDRMAFA